MLADALEHLVSGIVANPDDVRVREKDLRRGRMLEVRVNPSDLAGDEQIRIDFVDVDRRGSGRRSEHRGRRH